MTANSNHLIIEIDNSDDLINKDGIFIPNKNIENSKLTSGKIINVGPTCKLGFKENQTILFDKYAINKYNSIGILQEDNAILAEK